MKTKFTYKLNKPTGRTMSKFTEEDKAAAKQKNEYDWPTPYEKSAYQSGYSEGYLAACEVKNPIIESLRAENEALKNEKEDEAVRLEKYKETFLKKDHNGTAYYWSKMGIPLIFVELYREFKAQDK